MRNKLRSLFIVMALFAGVHPALAQSSLSIAPAGNQAVLFWSTNATNYVLQSTTNLVTGPWVTASNVVLVTVSNNVTVTVPYTSLAMFFRTCKTNTTVIPAAGMALIPAGSFMMGDTLDGEFDAIPTNVTVSEFYMDTNLVSYSQWLSAYNWATNNGYGFDNAGAGKAANHPVQTVYWYDVVKWSNARSQQAGLTPVYYTDAGFTQVYTNGDLGAVYANWAASGYRLPTEAEWEKAARGGLSGQRFPWGNTISENLANYCGNTVYSYDLGPNGFNAAFTNGATPYTSPVGYFAANGYGLYDMAGNVQEWCWDWFDENLSSVGSPYAGGTDPRGPASSPYDYRVLRGGYWYGYAYGARCADRYGDYPIRSSYYIGFRCVRRL